MTTVECDRHGFPFGRENARPAFPSYYVARCAHLSNRFIVEIRNARPTSGFIMMDYVEDIAPGGAEMIIEAHEPTSDQQADALWSRLYTRMTSGDGPRPDDV